MSKKEFYPLVDKIIAYEGGELRGQEVLDLFSYLIKTGQAWSLQGSYGRMAENLIDRGYLSAEGKILKVV
jgi:hypothetical protein